MPWKPVPTQYTRHTYYRRRDAGLCVTCGTPLVSAGVCCAACRTYRAVRYETQLTDAQRAARAERQRMRDLRAVVEAERAVMRDNTTRYGPHPAPPSPHNQLAHCGRWWDIPSIPYTLPCCGLRLEVAA